MQECKFWLETPTLLHGSTCYCVWKCWRNYITAHQLKTPRTHQKQQKTEKKPIVSVHKITYICVIFIETSINENDPGNSLSLVISGHFQLFFSTQKWISWHFQSIFQPSLHSSEKIYKNDSKFILCKNIHPKCLNNTGKWIT